MLLRLAIGWHFTSEGIQHHQEANWSSEGFLRAAKGPLAEQFRSKLPDDYGWEALMQGRPLPTPPNAQPAAASSQPAAALSQPVAAPTQPVAAPSQQVAAPSASAAAPPANAAPADPQAATSGDANQAPAAATASSPAATAPTAPAPAATAPAATAPAATAPAAPAAAPPVDLSDDAFKKFQLLFDGFNKLSSEQQREAHEVFAWLQRTNAAWDRYARQFESFYRLDDAGKTKIQSILERKQRELTEWAAVNLEPISKHGHEWARWSNAARALTAEATPYQKKRISENQARLSAEASGWLAAWRGMETDFRHDLRESLSPAQLASADFPPDQTELRKIDGLMKHAILGVGLCLVAGLFTRLASLVGAAFLLSVALSQPFWVAGTAPTYNQIVEMLALLALATTPVGRWGGLDFFIHSTFFGRCCTSAKGT